MDLHEAYYCFQHRLIPQTFFEDKVAFVNALAADNTKMLFSWMDSFFEHVGAENPYTEDMFGVDVMQYDQRVYIIKISFPKPEKKLSCYSGYMLFDKKCNKQMYFCVEKGEDDDFLCGWDSENRHYNYGKCDCRGREALNRCLRIYFKDK